MNEITYKKLDSSAFYQHIEKKQQPVFTDTVQMQMAANKVPYLTFSPFAGIPFLGHGFSTRLGGVSTGMYASMNLTFHMTDDATCVTENFRRMGEALGIACERMVYSKQTHTTNVLCVDERHCGMGVVRERSFDNIDGLITNQPNVCLVTSYADCVPLFFVDTAKKVIAAAHAGWRGTVGNIAKQTLTVMKETYGCHPEDIIAVTGPCICPNCYEVDTDVARQFQDTYTQEACQNIVTPKQEEGKYLLNLPMANYYHMVREGLSPKNIHISDICTSCNSDLLFSHRATKGKRGILCGFLYIKENS